jgi:hypothetical protein
MARLLNKIHQLSPTLFEQLTYDLVVLSGLTNVTWRTPGSDGGRDIEGEYQATDFSGVLRLERWYVECKRYKAAIDWPTVHNKIAHASAFSADYLLICTSSALSPSCKDALSAYSKQHEKPRVRAWEGPELELRVHREPALQVKYGFSADRRNVDSALAPLNSIVAKLINAAHGEQSAGGSASPSVEAASALAELIGRLAKIDPRGYQRQNARRLRQDDIYQWVAQDGAPGKLIDTYLFRAIVACLRFLTKTNRVGVKFIGANAFSISVVMPETRSVRALLDAVCTAANWEWRRLDGAVVFKARTEG